MARPLKIESALPQREVEICARLRIVRLEKKWSQPVIARELGVTRDMWASHEYGRAPVRFGLAYKFCAVFNRSLRWLAKGQDPKTPFSRISSSLLENINDRALFSSAYDLQLAALVDERIEELATRAGESPEKLGRASIIIDNSRLGVSFAEAHVERVVDFIRWAATQMPEAKRLRLGHELNDVIFKYWPWDSVAEEKSDVDKIPLKSKSVPVLSEIQKLIAQLNEVVQVPGRKKFLAEKLKVAPARISEWLSGKKEPGGNNALQLLYWAEKWESQQKRPGSASNTAKAKAQSERKYEQPNTSGPPKR